MTARTSAAPALRAERSSGLARAAWVSAIVAAAFGVGACGAPATPRTAALGDGGVLPAAAPVAQVALAPLAEGLCKAVPAGELAELAGVESAEASSTDGSSCTYTLAGGGAVLVAYATEGYEVSERSAKGRLPTTIRNRPAYFVRFDGAYPAALLGVALGAPDAVALRVYVDAPTPVGAPAASGDQTDVAARVAAAVIGALGG